MIHYKIGNLLESEAEALVNTVNTVGVMGKGIALQFKNMFPINFKEYAKACKNKEVNVGKLLITEEVSLLSGKKIIINFPTKTNWRLPSEFSYIESGLIDLVKEIKDKLNDDLVWQMLIEQSLGQTLDQYFKDDLVKGVVLTDGLIGTFASAYEMQSNICFLYHLIGNGTGEWKVPKGGMGALTSELHQKALSLGVEIKVNSKVKSIDTQNLQVVAELENGEKFEAGYLLSNAAPQVLSQLLGKEQPKSLEGSQVKINMLLKKMPKFKSGIDAKDAFVGTLHINESFTQLEKAYNDAKSGLFPNELPLEMYCHTLTDTSILSEDLHRQGYHTLTIFGIHTPAHLFDKQPNEVKEVAKKGALSALNQYLESPIENHLATDSQGNLCIEIKSPLDLEQELALPRGNIFQKDLSACGGFRFAGL